MNDDDIVKVLIDRINEFEKESILDNVYKKRNIQTNAKEILKILDEVMENENTEN